MVDLKTDKTARNVALHVSLKPWVLGILIIFSVVLGGVIVYELKQGIGQSEAKALFVVVLVQIVLLLGVAALFSKSLFKEYRDARKAESFLEIMVENIPSMIFVKEAKDLKFVKFNKAGEDLIGVSREEMIGKNDYDFFPKEQADFFTSKDRKVLESGAVEDIPEEPIDTQHQGQRWLHTKKVPIVDENGVPLYLVGISYDITEQKLHKENAERYALAVSCVKHGVWDWNIVTDEVYYSPELRELLGYAGDDFVNIPNESVFEERIHPDDQARIMQAFEDHIEHGTRFDVEQRNKVSTGEYRYFRSRGEAIRDENGKAIRMVGTIWDINDQKELEEHEKERQKMESLGRMAGGVAHEINNLLLPITLSAEVVRESDEISSDALKENLNVVVENARMAGKIVQDVLVFSRSGLNKERKNTDIRTLLKNTVTYTHTLLPDTVEVVFSEPAAFPHTCKVSESEFKQVLTNILLNASYAMNQGGKITIELNNKDVSGGEVAYLEAGNYVTIYITDQGPGIPAAVQDKIFEPFFTTKDIGEGTGLGLAIVFGILKDWGGTIALDKTSSQGTTFALYIPVSEAAAQPSESAA